MCASASSFVNVKNKQQFPIENETTRTKQQNQIKFIPIPSKINQLVVYTMYCE